MAHRLLVRGNMDPPSISPPAAAEASKRVEDFEFTPHARILEDRRPKGKGRFVIIYQLDITISVPTTKRVLEPILTSKTRAKNTSAIGLIAKRHSQEGPTFVDTAPYTNLLSYLTAQLWAVVAEAIMASLDWTSSRTM